MYHVISVFKEDMAESKIGWLILKGLGWIIAFLPIFSELSKILANIQPIQLEEPYLTIMTIFGIVFMFVQCLRAVEKYRKEKMENDDRAKEFKKKWNDVTKK